MSIFSPLQQSQRKGELSPVRVPCQISQFRFVKFLYLGMSVYQLVTLPFSLVTPLKLMIRI